MGSLFDEDIVTMAIARFTGVLDVGAKLGIDVLNEGAAGGHVHHLDAETDAEGGNAALASDPGKGQIIALPPGIHRLDTRMRLFTVDRRIAIVPSREQDAIQPLGDGLGIFRLRRNDYRHRSGATE